MSGGGPRQDECDSGAAGERCATPWGASGIGARLPHDGGEAPASARPCLIAIGGASGSGKSTLALGLAPSVGAVPGAVVLRSDEIRKRLCGVSLLERLGPEGYSSQVSDRVYATVAERARVTVRGGHSAIVDAVYVRPTDRPAIQRVAADASLPFVGLWLDAPESTLIERAQQRRNDPSDADADVIRMQRAQQTGLIGWHRLDASLPAEIVLQCATTYLREKVRDAMNTAGSEAR